MQTKHTLALIALVVVVLGAALYFIAGAGTPGANVPLPAATATTTLTQEAASTNPAGATTRTTAPQTGTKAPAPASAPAPAPASPGPTTVACALSVTVGGGGIFAPASCTFKAITGGGCTQATCPATYALTLTDGAPGRIQSVVLSPNSRITGTYTFSAGGKELTGTLTNAQGLSYTLTSATMTLSPLRDNHEGITFDATFANGVTVRGQGTLPITQATAP